MVGMKAQLVPVQDKMNTQADDDMQAELPLLTSFTVKGSRETEWNVGFRGGFC